MGSGREPPPPLPLLWFANLGSLLVEKGEARQGAKAGKGTQQTGERDGGGHRRRPPPCGGGPGERDGGEEFARKQQPDRGFGTPVGIVGSAH